MSRNDNLRQRRPINANEDEEETLEASIPAPLEDVAIFAGVAGGIFVASGLDSWSSLFSTFAAMPLAGAAFGFNSGQQLNIERMPRWEHDRLGLHFAAAAVFTNLVTDIILGDELIENVAGFDNLENYNPNRLLFGDSSTSSVLRGALLGALSGEAVRILNPLVRRISQETQQVGAWNALGNFVASIPSETATEVGNLLNDFRTSLREYFRTPNTEVVPRGEAEADRLLNQNGAGRDNF